MRPALLLSASLGFRITDLGIRVKGLGFRV